MRGRAARGGEARQQKAVKEDACKKGASNIQIKKGLSIYSDTYLSPGGSAGDENSIWWWVVVLGL
jgi:hypothetical protein